MASRAHAHQRHDPFFCKHTHTHTRKAHTHTPEPPNTNSRGSKIRSPSSTPSTPTTTDGSTRGPQTAAPPPRRRAAGRTETAHTRRRAPRSRTPPLGVAGEPGVGTPGGGVAHRGRLLECDIDAAARGVLDGLLGLVVEVVVLQAVAERSQGAEMGAGARATQPSDRRT